MDSHPIDQRATRALATNAEIAQGVTVLRAGGVVAFPTETVYGLGADALNAAAVARVFLTKGRPSTNPLIVHVTGIEMAKTLASSWPIEAELLARALWPGPLTIVVPKAAAIPALVTAGGSTVALRQPAHLVAAALLKAFGGPLVGPSANVSGHVSPTTSAHVRTEFGDRVRVLEGGTCSVGIESTVVEILGNPPTGLVAEELVAGGLVAGRLVAGGLVARVLRPGAISAEVIARVLGVDLLHVATGLDPSARARANQAILQSPGMLESHYAPQTRAVLAEPGDADTRGAAKSNDVIVYLPTDAAACARELYALVRDADVRAISNEASQIIIVLPKPRAELLASAADPLWRAILDRLDRASA